VPVRAEFFAVATELPDGPPSLLVLGGSQGARQVNRLVPEAVGRLERRFPDLAVRHQCGAAHVGETQAAYFAAHAERIEVVPFIADVAAAMAAAHLVVSRAGALTVAEICAAGRPALLLPLAIAGAHQVENARLLAEAGAAHLLDPEGLDAEALAAALGELLADRATLRRMAAAARALARPDAVGRIADRVAVLAAGEGR
jgi:UDP-N-acetylglucosamine--N-acetylmuramyl-(pentapeptide) pyrophosphoryl-undecaprenol N-acetylglucosamine transferase